MKVVSMHVPEDRYEELKSLAARQGRSVADLMRQAMAEFLDRSGPAAHSVLDIKPHESGRCAGRWTRDEILDEMRQR